MKLIFRFSGSWIVIDKIESCFHFHEVLYILGLWNMPTGGATDKQSHRLTSRRHKMGLNKSLIIIIWNSLDNFLIPEKSLELHK